MRRVILPALVVTAALAAPARAEIAVLASGQTLKVSAWRIEGDSLQLTLREGGEVGLPVESVQGLLPDEVMEAVEEVVPAAQAGGNLRELAVAAARRHGLDPALVLAVATVESGFRPDAVSPKGARGLMQLMPMTAAELGVVDAFDPAQNLDGGARQLGWLLGRYRGDLRKVLAAYNAGAGAVERFGGVPPYPETRDYVEKVLKRARKER